MTKPREIKFRAWDKDYARMVGPLGIADISYKSDGGTINLADWEDLVNVEDLEWMQFTGLKDKNGKEIYEGDIVRSDVEKVVVEWKGEMWTEEGFITGFSELFEGGNCYEVVGNIYENPDMLKND